jgi:hypothetical protein
MRKPETTADRLGAFSDGVLAVIITIMVLELKAPDKTTFSALLPLWSIMISYAVSYLFIAIIWLNHHHLLRFVDRTTPALIWVNFAHLRGVARAVRDRLDRAHAASLSAGGHVRGDLCLREPCLHRVRAPGAGPGRRRTGTGTRQAHGQASILRHPVDLRKRHAGGPVRAAHRLRPDLLRPAPLPDAGGTWRSAVSASPQLTPRRNN